MRPELLPALIRHLRHPTGDAELVRRYTALRDGEAFAELLSRHGPLVWGVCRRRLPNRADAEDAFQATFLVLAKRAAAIRRPESLGCWLYGVAHRVAGRMRARPLPTVPDPAPPCPAAPVGEAATAREFLAALDEELLRLPEKLHGPLVLCFLQERTQDEAARQLGVSLSTLKRRLGEGRELLRVRLTGRGVELSAALAAAGLAVPWSVADAAVKAAVEGAAGVVSANVLTVTEGVVRAMAYAKLKAWTAGVLMIATSAGGTGYFALTGAGQTGSPDGGTIPKQAGRPDLDEVVHLLKAEADVKAAELEVVRTQDRLRQFPNDRVVHAELRVAEARLAAAKAQWDAVRARAAKQKDAERDRKATERERKAFDGLMAAARSDQTHKLKEEKLAAARKVLEMETKNAVAGRSVGTVYTWSRRVMEAERDLDPSAAARTKSGRAHLDRMKKLDDALQGAAGASRIEKAETTYYRAEAEAWLKDAAARPAAPKEGSGVAAEVEKLKLELEALKHQAAAELNRAEQLAERIQKLMDERDKSRQEGVHPFLPRVAPGDRSPLVPEGFKGAVRRVEGTTKDLYAGRDVFVELTPGADAGLKPGAVLTVCRMDGQSAKYLGTVMVLRANAKDAVGQFMPANSRKVGADDLPKSGDTVLRVRTP